ncbi:MAG: hypothetical protein RBT37_00250 [Dissulfurispiraceae bacterium]|nr:hypothetical protein [Dissulfurispiraceae bacterium]
MAFILVMSYSVYKADYAFRASNANAEAVKKFVLTDLCLFTEARYTRHPSIADIHTPFQDFPGSFEHFPSGSMVPVPDHLRRGYVLAE